MIVATPMLVVLGIQLPLRCSHQSLTMPICESQDNKFIFINNKQCVTHQNRRSVIRMKVRASVKKISPDDKIVRRKGRVYVINKF